MEKLEKELQKQKVQELLQKELIQQQEQARKE